MAGLGSSPPGRPVETTPADEVTHFLTHQHENQITSPHIYIHGKPISFYNAKDKTEWSPFVPDIGRRDTYSSFTNANRSGSWTTLGLFQTWGGTRVGQPQGAWLREDWHCWLGATIRMAGRAGKVVIIWDSNMAQHSEDVGGNPARSLIFNDLIAPQRKFVNIVRVGLGASGVTAVWYGGSGNSVDNRICTTLAARQLERRAETGISVDSEELVEQGFILVRGNAN